MLCRDILLNLITCRIWRLQLEFEYQKVTRPIWDYFLLLLENRYWQPFGRVFCKITEHDSIWLSYKCCEIFGSLGRLIKFLSQNAGIRTSLWEFNYDKNEVRKMDFREDDVFAGSLPPQSQSEDTCLPVLDLEVLTSQYTDDNFTGKVKVWSDKVAKDIGNCLYGILQKLYLRKLNNPLTTKFILACKSTWFNLS